MQPKPDPLTTAQGLTKALTDMTGRLERVQKDSIERDSVLGKYGKRNRVYILVDVVLTVLFAVTGALSVHAAMQASRADSAQLALCQAGNVARAQQIQLWEYVAHVGKQPTTKQGREVVARFEHHVHVIFAPRNCAALGGRKP